MKFTKSACYVPGKNHKMIAKASKVGSLYQPNHETASLAEKTDTKEDIWHRQFGHLGLRASKS